MTKKDPSILWRRVDHPGHEAATISSEGSGWLLTGTTVFAQEGLLCRLGYLIDCNRAWETVSAHVEGSVDNQPINFEITVDSDRHWYLNEVECPQVTGCVDIDLNFSPVTNLLPIRRLKLNVGQEAAVSAALLRFPSFSLEPLAQRYTRLGELNYRYESAGGSFTRDLSVNEVGFVTEYPGLWSQEAD